MAEENPQRSRSERAREAIAALAADWREIFSRCVDEAERFTRDKPAAGLAAAFLTGFVAASLLRRR